MTIASFGVENMAISVATKTKLAILWLFVTGSNLAIVSITFIAPGVIDDIRAGHVLGAQIGSDLLFIIAITYFWIPLVMVVLSVTLKDVLVRWLNVIAGLLYAGFVISEFVSNIMKVDYFYGLWMQMSEVIVLLLIVWFGFKHNKESG